VSASPFARQRFCRTMLYPGSPIRVEGFFEQGKASEASSLYCPCKKEIVYSAANKRAGARIF
jgi:hypothetical protein